MFPQTGKAYLVTPTGSQIFLEFRDGTWFLPSPSSQAFVLRSGKPFHLSPPVLPLVTASPVSPVQLLSPLLQASPPSPGIVSLIRHSGPPAIPITLADANDERICSVQALHEQLGHPGRHILAAHIRGMVADDPLRPSWPAFARWRKIGHCLQCMENSKLPPSSRAHPHTDSRESSLKPGEFLTVDGGGSYNFPTLDHLTQHFVVSCAFSKGQWAFPTPDKLAGTLIVLLKQFIIDGQCMIKCLQGDADALGSTVMAEWARSCGI